jgi:hypothetical protein
LTRFLLLQSSLAKVNRLTIPVRVFSIGSGVFLLVAMWLFQKLNAVSRAGTRLSFALGGVAILALFYLGKYGKGRLVDRKLDEARRSLCDYYVE